MGCLLWNNGIKEQRGEKGLNRWLYCEAASSPPTTQSTCTEGSFRPSSNGSAVDTAFLTDRANGELGTFCLGYAGSGVGSSVSIKVFCRLIPLKSINNCSLYQNTAICLSVPSCPNIASTNDMRLGQDYVFIWPMANGGMLRQPVWIQSIHM